MNEPEVLGREAEQSDALDWAARIGLVAYGVLYVLIGWVALQLALGDHSQDASATGAMSELAREPLGRALVWAVAIGLLLMSFWRAVEAGFGHREHEGVHRVRRRLASGGKAVAYAVLAFVAFKVAVAGGSGSSQQKQQTMTAKLMDLPAGQWIVALVGLGIIVYAVVVARQGWKETFAEGLRTEGKLGWSGAGYLLLGKIGHLAKALAFAIVGGLVCYAGISHEPGKSGGLDEALQTVLRQPYGPYLLVVIAAGIACFGLFCFAWARHLDR